MSTHDARDAAAASRTPPPPPEPNADRTAGSIDASFSQRSDDPLQLDSEAWNIHSVSALGALRMLIGALETLADATGDVPPTPPVSRPTTPRKYADPDNIARRTSSPEDSVSRMHIGSPVAHPLEPITIEHGADVQDINLQRIAIARRFFSKTAPAFPVSDYLLRLHQWCPHSPGVYLTAAVYCYQLCVADLMVPATSRTIHRLALASIRVAEKAVEDNKWTQERTAKVGGVSKTQLMNLEVTMCFLLDFELGVDPILLAKRVFLLQQAGRQGMGTRGLLGNDFRLRIPLRRRRTGPTEA